jgi:putative ABC transport system permease protein
MIFTSVHLAASAVARHALRSLLTVLGIVIGVASVITLVTLGNGISATVASSISGLGSNLLEIMPGQFTRGGGWSARQFTLADASAIVDQVGALEHVVPIGMRTVRAVHAGSNWNTPVVGTDNGYLAAMRRTVSDGRSFNDSELRNGARVCLLGATVRDKLFGGAGAVGARIRLQNLACRVIGVLDLKGNSLGEDQDDVVLMPIRTYQRRVAGNTDVVAILLSAAPDAVTAQVKRDVELLLRERRRIAPGEEDDFSVLDVTQLGETLASTTGLLTNFLSAVAGISLLVGGIGIMNIMLVSVTERTREIGVRLAVGAAAHQVLAQFLIESAVLSTLGGVLGIAAGLGIAAIAGSVLSVPIAADPAVVGLAFGFSAVVGVVFGFLPARRAANLNPIEALRRE